MNVFLRNILIFFGLMFGYFALNVGINLYFIQTTPPRIAEATTLIVGDSHMRRAVDPQYIPGTSNIAQQAETYYVSFWKLRTLTRHNDIDTIIIGCSPHNFSTFNDVKLIHARWSNELFNRIYPITTTRDYRGIEYDIVAYIRSIVKNLCLYPHKGHITYIGSFEGELATKLENPENNIQRHFYLDGTPCDTSHLSAAYLDSLIAHAHRRGIVPVLVSPPLHDSYAQLLPSKFAVYHSNIINKYRDQGITVFKSSQTFTDAEFYDADHLNVSGAGKFTKELIDYLRTRRQTGPEN